MVTSQSMRFVASIDARAFDVDARVARWG